MRPRVHKAIKQFLSSPEATASAFSSIGWDVERSHGEHAFWCLVNYGILEEMELSIVAHADGTWFAELFIPPILARYEVQAEQLCKHLAEDYPPLVAAVDVDRSVLLGVAGCGDPTPQLTALWRAFAAPRVYQTVLLLCGCTAPTPEDKLGFDIPDNPFED